MTPKSWIIKDILKVTVEYLKKKGIDSPRLCAEVLLAHQLNIDRVKLYLNFDQPLNQSEIEGYRSLIKRRLNREPIQYITGVQEFWSLEFMVGPEVLIPRPESELLVERAILLQRDGKLPEGARILDLGTGSGVLAVSLARELEKADLWASDLSRPALDLARSNAGRHGVEERITFLQGDLWEALEGQGMQFDMIVSNPPYIPSRDMDTLPPEVRNFEPCRALDGGEGGMSFISKIILEGHTYLKAGGWILLEMDPGQTEGALDLVGKSAMYLGGERLKDYSDRFRLVIAQKKY